EEVRKSLEKERELNDLKSKFVSIASHEFRTPLSTVMSSAALIQQYKDKQDYDKQDKHILRIKSSVNHLTQILNDFLSLGIRDEGIGIPKEDQKHLFDRFYRASNAGNVQGTGLGLNIVKRYAELIGGDISFKSEFEKGSTFFITLP